MRFFKFLVKEAVVYLFLLRKYTPPTRITAKTRSSSLRFSSKLKLSKSRLKTIKATATKIKSIKMRPPLISADLNRYFSFDMRMMLIILKCKIIKSEIENIFNFRIENHFWKWFWVP